MTGEAPRLVVPPWRRGLLLAVLTALALGLVVRAAELIVHQGEFLVDQGNQRVLRVVEIPTHRGRLLDRHGELLAVSTPVDSLWAEPAELAGARERWPELARALGMSVAALERRAAAGAGREFVYLERHAHPDVAREVLDLEVPGVSTLREYRRYYPTAEVAAHVVGFTNVDDEGQEGMELALDARLRGRPGAKRVVRDRLGHIVENVESIRLPEPGADVHLSIDHRIQYLSYRALKEATRRHRAQGGSVVVLDPRSGEVLAAVNQPFYNPNKRSDRVGGRYRNRALTDLFEPGSTLKPFTVAAGLATRRFRVRSEVDTRPGLLRVGRYTVRDHRDYGVLDMAQVLKKSSNVGATRIALEIPRAAHWKVLDGVGFGQAPGTAFPGESRGVLTDFTRWGEIHRATLSYGYGLSVSTLQLARAYGVLAADGVLRPASLVRRDAAPEGEQVLPAGVAVQVRRMLEGVVAPGGTGTRARVPGYRVAGKTGTVKKSVAGGYAEDRYLSVFAGMAPATDPRLVVVAVVDEPRSEQYYGGQVAAPLFARVMAGSLRTLGVAPDAADDLGSGAPLLARAPGEDG